MKREVIDWLMEGDPSIRYQTKRDLLESSPSSLQTLQNEIGEDGWGKRFLSFQDKSGLWGGGLYSPKWISTHYTLMTLLRLGLSPDNEQAKKGCRILLDKGYYPKDGGINHFKSMNISEICVTAMTLSLLCHFNIMDDRLANLNYFLLDQQMPDGGWNCERYRGATHSSFHTTISVLESLAYVEKTEKVKSEDIGLARTKGHEFLLQHHLFRSDKTGEIVNQAMTRFSFPPRWKYDIMRALDYFQEVNAPHDPRFCDAITLLKKKEKNGKWPLQQKYAGLIYFDMEKPGKPSRMNTVRALRILKWWQTRPHTMQCAN